MSKAPSWYAEWRNEAFDALMAKQDALQAEMSLGAWPRFDYDLTAGSLTFSDAESPRVRGDIQIVGTVGKSNWLWAWANAAWPASSFEDLLKVRDFGLEHGIEELTSEYVEHENLDGTAWMLTAVAARILDAPGAYKAATSAPKRGFNLFRRHAEKPTPFFLFRSVGFVN